MTRVHAESHVPDPNGGAEQVSTYDSQFEATILAVDGPAPSRVELRFVRNAYGYQGHPSTTALEGKVYTVDAHAPHVRDATSGAAPDDESQRVLDVFPDLGTRARIDEVLPDEPMHVGDRRDDLAAAILRVIHPRSWTLTWGTATLARGGAGPVFDVTMDATSDTGLAMKLHGTATIDAAEARLTELVLEGPFETATAGQSAVPAQAPGTFSLRRTVTWEMAPRSDR